MAGGVPWWLSSKESFCRCRRHEFNPWVRKIPWRRAWQATPAFLPGKSHGQRSLADFSPWCRRESRLDWSDWAHTHKNICVCITIHIPIPKKGNAKECSNYHTIVLISHASKVMLKILQARLQQYMNHELPDVQAGFIKGRGMRDQITYICWIIEKVRKFQKSIYFCFMDYAKAFDCVDHNKLWKILKEMGIPDHLTCLLKNLHPSISPNVWHKIGAQEGF